MMMMRVLQTGSRAREAEANTSMDLRRYGNCKKNAWQVSWKAASKLALHFRAIQTILKVFRRYLITKTQKAVLMFRITQM